MNRGLDKSDVYSTVHAKQGAVLRFSFYQNELQLFSRQGSLLAIWHKNALEEFTLVTLHAYTSDTIRPIAQF